jgi:D-glycero-D-manno-heptose 1,7-bisphosphate phosphatase
VRALFLDRDGVINEERNYVHRQEDFIFIDGIFSLCRAAMDAGYDIFVITNQAGIARGYYSIADFEVLTEWMIAIFAREGVVIRKVYFCPYHPAGTVAEFRKNARCRKPQPGMILQARDEFGIDLARSVLVGDKESDIEAGRRAGVGTLIRVSPADEGLGPTEAFFRHQRRENAVEPRDR